MLKMQSPRSVRLVGSDSAGCVGWEQRARESRQPLTCSCACQTRQECVSWNYWPPLRCNPILDFHPWLESSWASGLKREERICFLIVFLSPQPEALHVNLEMGDQEGWAVVGHVSALCHLACHLI